MSRHFTEKDIKITKRTWKLFNIIIHQENANPNHTHKIVTTLSASQDGEKLDHSCIASGSVPVRHSGKWFGSFLPCEITWHSSEFSQRNGNLYSQRDMYIELYL